MSESTGRSAGSTSETFPNVVLVTGAAGGMGAGHAKALAARGVHVCVADVADSSAVMAEIEAAVAARRRTNSTSQTPRPGPA